MRSVNRWSRRAVLGAAAVAGVGATGLIARSWFGGNSGRGSDASFPELLRQSIFDLDIPCNSAERYLSDQVSGGGREHDISGIVALVRKRLDMHGNSVSGYPGNEQRIDVEGLIRLLARGHQGGFRNRPTLRRGGMATFDDGVPPRGPRNFYGNGITMEVRTLFVGRHLCMLVATPPKLSKILPRRTIVGVPFTVQANGKSVINVYGTGFQSGAQILFDDVPLESAVGHSGWMNAYVPTKFYSRNRIMDVAVRNPDGKGSNPIRFAVVSNSD